MKKRNVVLALAFALVIMLIMAACTSVQVSGTLTLNADGSGHRVIEGYVAKMDHKDGYGSAYYYLKKHGSDLESYIEGVYSERVADSEGWLSVSVDDSGIEWEIITLSFDFESFEDYTAKLRALCYDETAAASYSEPTLEQAGDGRVTYLEPSGLMTAVYKSLQNTIMADDSIYDPASTKDGVALNDGSADGQLEVYGVELMKTDYGDALSVGLNGGRPAAAELVDEVFTITRTSEGAEITEDKEVTRVLYYSFDNTLANTGTSENNDLAFGELSTPGGPVYADGVNGSAVKLDGATYLASANRTYGYKEMTISFYYRMDNYTDTDTGANMIIVPAGLGALGAGVIDLEFIKDEEAGGIMFLAKMNSSDWQTQDKLYSEGYLMESHMSEWHNYTIVYKNDYDGDGAINESYVFLYIDGKLAARSRLSVAAGLTYGLGRSDDGSAGNANGGFNIGGYMENGTVKRACTGLLDEFMVYDGALSESEIQELIYTVKVENEYDPDIIDTAGDSTGDTTSNTSANTSGNTYGNSSDNNAAASTQSPSATKTPASNTSSNNGDSDNSDNGNIILIVIIVVAAIAVLTVLYVVIVKTKRKPK